MGCTGFSSASLQGGVGDLSVLGGVEKRSNEISLTAMSKIHQRPLNLAVSVN